MPHPPAPEAAHSVAVLFGDLAIAIALTELEPTVRAVAERLLERIPEESLGRESQACRVALSLSRCRP